MSFWRNFRHWLHWKLSNDNIHAVQSVTKISSKWWHFGFSAVVAQHSPTPQMAGDWMPTDLQLRQIGDSHRTVVALVSATVGRKPVANRLQRMCERGFRVEIYHLGVWNWLILTMDIIDLIHGHCSDVTPVSWCLKSPTTWLFVQLLVQADKNIRTHSDGNPPTIAPSTSHAENVSMSWRHHRIERACTQSNKYRRNKRPQILTALSN